ncbi:MAG: PhnD/SsuA/transferrin family substrate-binding protein [Methylovulum sp.]|uniref:PhnD/SsuA/transferrin family substrate-binding protein n=1 Tax=Methylovulum sp. TaxID=1916980 RepID=UPI002638DAAE|nr:PhnD/SsuA/transferrin family substrate-binding protein [Methylovulum sp.]MDD2724746.1 PhnD/SsuA/transferrin family substrate-binding protein [Methylovulum sp.]MDD5124757.1 PhnD/SsuA/transferrin family substrate-binding protein [Methylovulum sp.]
MNQSKLKIQPQPSPEKLAQQFYLVGTVDVDAVETLETLYVLPPRCSVELDFSQVDRVNSMGLAQLLKLFELWQNHNNRISVTNTNRMIGILFKMTGLTRFLADEQADSTAAVAAPPVSAPAQHNQAILDAANPVTSESLQIKPQPSTTSLNQQFIFNGMIDVNAVELLETLYVIPENCSVTLNFALVQRVNSMGLAQLLKLFQHWQERNVSISVTNTNRMIGILFKMTGLTRFLADEQTPAPATATASAPVANIVQPRQKAPLEIAVPPPALRRIHDAHSTVDIQAHSDKLSLWVSAQSSQQMNGWYFFNTYLQRHLGREIHLELSHGAMTEQRKKIEENDIVFTKPFEATRLMLEHHYKPLLRPIDQADEVTLLVRSEDKRQHLKDYIGGKIVTAAQDNFVYLLGRFLLEESESSLAHMEHVFSGHDIKALQMLLKGSADILFMLSDTYKGLSGLTRKMLREIDQSETAFAFHMFSVAPHCAGLGDALSEVLLDMNQDSQGRQVLADLGIPGWIKPTHDECEMLAMLFNRYAPVNP